MAKKKTVKKKSAGPKKQTPSFEESLASLEKIVAELEAGDLTLSESIQRYEKGVQLLKQCHGTLDRIQQKIELLTGVDEDGNIQTKAFNDDSAQGDSNAATQSDHVDVDDGGRLF